MSMKVLRPTWLPSAFQHGMQVAASAGYGGDKGGYNAYYCASNCPDVRSSELDLMLNPILDNHLAGTVLPVKVRRTTGTFTIYRSGPTYKISWREAGQRYAVFGNKVWPSTLFRVVASLRIAPR